MIVRTSVTRGNLEITRKRGKLVENFCPSENGNDCEVYIQFDNGSVLGYTKPNNVEAYIANTVKEFDEIPTCENW